MRRNIEINLQQDEWEKKDSFQGYQEEESLSPLFIIFTTEEDTVDDAVQDCLDDEIGCYNCHVDTDDRQLRLHDILTIHIIGGIEIEQNGNEHSCHNHEKLLEANLIGRFRDVSHIAWHIEEVFYLS